MDIFQCSFHLILSLNSYCKFHLLQKKSSELLYFALFFGQYLSCNWFIKDTELIQASYYKKSATYCEDFQCLSFSVFVLVTRAVLPTLCWVGSSCKRRWSSSHYMQVYWPAVVPWVDLEQLILHACDDALKSPILNWMLLTDDGEDVSGVFKLLWITSECRW